jgi:hypothetical protein
VNGNTVRYQVFAAVLFTLFSSVQASEQQFQPETSLELTPGRQAALNKSNSEETRQTSLRTEITTLRGEVASLRREVQQLIQHLESRSPVSSGNRQASSGPPHISQNVSNDGRPRDNGDNENSSTADASEPQMATSLTLREAISIGLSNCSSVETKISPGVDGNIEIRPKDTNLDVAITRAYVTALIRAIDDAFVDLWVAHDGVHTARQARRASLDLWKEVYRESDGSEAWKKDEAAARAQYFDFRGRLEESTQSVQRSERRLRALLGLAGSDGRLLVPDELPDRSSMHLDSEQYLERVFSNSPEIQEQAAIVCQSGRQLMSRNSDAPSPCVTDYDGPPTGLQLARLNADVEKLRLEELKKDAAHRFALVVQQYDSTRHLLQTHRLRRIAAEKEVEALDALAHGGQSIEVDVRLDARRRWAASCSDCRLNAARLFSATEKLLTQKGTLLEWYGVEIRI